MRKTLVTLTAIGALAALPATAAAGKDTAPGQVIKSECDGQGFGALISSLTPGFNQGQHAKENEGKPGAKAFSGTIHGVCNDIPV